MVILEVWIRGTCNQVALNILQHRDTRPFLHFGIPCGSAAHGSVFDRGSAARSAEAVDVSRHAHHEPERNGFVCQARVKSPFRGRCSISRQVQQAVRLREQHRQRHRHRHRKHHIPNGSTTGGAVPFSTPIDYIFSKLPSPPRAAICYYITNLTHIMAPAW